MYFSLYNTGLHKEKKFLVFFMCTIPNGIKKIEQFIQ